MSSPISNHSDGRRLVSRRNVLASVAAATALTATPRNFLFGGPSRSSKAESVAGELFESLTDEQRATVALSFEDPLRSRVNPNWHVVKPTVGSSFYSKSQQAMANQIVRELTSPTGYERLQKQTEEDDGGIEAYSMAWFGKPGDKQFEWMLTGRHLTLRADGNSIEKVAFGGPIIYGHGEESSPKDNLFYYQTEKVNALYAALDSKQREQAVVPGSAGEQNVTVDSSGRAAAGLSIGTLHDDQRKLFVDALASILAPYREEDAAEAMRIIDSSNGGVSGLKIAYYKDGDLLKDGIWDDWRIEGVNTVIHFRGAPHVHAYIHVAG